MTRRDSNDPGTPSPLPSDGGGSGSDTNTGGGGSKTGVGFGREEKPENPPLPDDTSSEEVDS